MDNEPKHTANQTQEIFKAETGCSMAKFVM